MKELWSTEGALVRMKDLMRWEKLKEKNNVQLHIIEKTDICEFNIFTEKSINGVVVEKCKR